MIHSAAALDNDSGSKLITTKFDSSNIAGTRYQVEEVNLVNLVKYAKGMS